MVTKDSVYSSSFWLFYRYDYNLLFDIKIVTAVVITTLFSPEYSGKQSHSLSSEFNFYSSSGPYETKLNVVSVVGWVIGVESYNKQICGASIRLDFRI